MSSPTFEQGAERIKFSVLPSGVRVLTEVVEHVESVAIGFWMVVGSRDEQTGQHGSTHFLEHLLFKGTPTRTAAQIAAAFDSVGGEFNAATAKESTCYYARVLAADAPMAVEVLADMLACSKLDPLDFETERGVILEELAMSQDDPSEVAHETFAEVVYGDHPLARPIGGTPNDIQQVSRDAVWEHYQRYYRPWNLVVTASGKLDPDGFLALVTDTLDQVGWGVDALKSADQADGAAGRPHGFGPHAPAPRRPVTPEVALPVHGRVEAVAKPFSQTQVMVGCSGLTATDPRRYAMMVFSSILGGGMSSRLFQTIREQRGLAYSTYCFSHPHSDVGSFGVYAACAPTASAEVTGLMEAEWELLAANGPTDDEMARVKGQIRGSALLANEEAFAHMNRLGRGEILMGELPSIHEVLGRVDAVTAADVRELGADLAARARSRVVVGPA